MLDPVRATQGEPPHMRSCAESTPRGARLAAELTELHIARPLNGRTSSKSRLYRACRKIALRAELFHIVYYFDSRPDFVEYNSAICGTESRVHLKPL